MTISSDEFRNILRLFPSGVTLVTSLRGEQRHGMTVSAFVSVSASPPLVAVMIDQGTGITPLLEADDACFAVNVLAADQEELSNRFAFKKDEDRFAVGDWSVAKTGAPVLGDAVAWLDCRVKSRHREGSHTIYVGSVEASATPRAEASPLIYCDRGYRRLDARP